MKAMIKSTQTVQEANIFHRLKDRELNIIYKDA